MTESESIKICNTIGFATSFSNHQGIPLNTTKDELAEAMRMAIQALEKQEKIKDLLDSCTAYPDDMCDCLVEIEKILRSDEEWKKMYVLPVNIMKNAISPKEK